MSSQDTSNLCSQVTNDIIPFKIATAYPNLDKNLEKSTQIISKPEPSETIRFSDSGYLKISFPDGLAEVKNLTIKGFNIETIELKFSIIDNQTTEMVFQFDPISVNIDYGDEI